MTTETKGHPSAADAHLVSSAEALRLWLCDSRGEVLGGNRVAAMMVALAAEGYINAALLTLLDQAEFEAVDRLPTPEKYFTALRVAAPKLAVSRGTHEGGCLVKLFRTRNHLTHSKTAEERALFPPRTEVGEWIGSVAKLVSGWPLASDGALSDQFGRYTAPFAKRAIALKSRNGEEQLDALADALDECSPFEILMTPVSAPPGAISIISTELPKTPREPLWITHLDPGDPQDLRKGNREMRP